MTSKPLSLDVLDEAMSSGAAAIRARTRLQPAGGPGDKLFPPTFGDTIRVPMGDGTTQVTRYAVETRRLGGNEHLCVLLDSVASQANRMEEALQRAWDEESLEFPLVRVDFTGATDDDPLLDLSVLGGDGYLSALEAPHRLADALLRDSMLGELRFRASAPGRQFTEASPLHATPVYTLCPTALIFGMWDSTGPRGAQGAKFQRALVSEIIGVGVAFGRKTASRIDPAGIELGAGPIYRSRDEDEEWTAKEEEALTDGKTPILFSRKAKKESNSGKPASINHGNIKPSIDSEAGGVTLDHAEQITVLSLPALRRLRFPTRPDGSSVPKEDRKAVETAARRSLAALALAALSFQRDEGFDLRSRCALVPEGPLSLEIVDRDGGVAGPFSLPSEEARTLLAEASKKAAAVNMGWSSEPVDLVPAPKLVELIRKSRKASASGEDDEG